jgi:hypothetical protein
VRLQLINFVNFTVIIFTDVKLKYFEFSKIFLGKEIIIDFYISKERAGKRGEGRGGEGEGWGTVAAIILKHSEWRNNGV